MLNTKRNATPVTLYEDAPTVAELYRSGEFPNAEQALGAFRLAYLQSIDSDCGPAAWMGLNATEFDTWMRDDVLPPMTSKPQSPQQPNSYVYLLMASNKPVFKIGKANDVKKRIRTLPKEVIFNKGKSIVLKCKSSEVYKIESMLHFFFRAYKQPAFTGSGENEWFNVDCFDEVLRFVKNNKERLGVSEIKPIEKQ